MLEKRESKLKVLILVLAIGLFFYWHTSLPSRGKGEYQIVFPTNIYTETTNDQAVKDFLAKTSGLKELFDKALEYYGDEKYLEAGVILERIVSENKTFRDGYYFLAETYLKLSENDNDKKNAMTRQIDETKYEIQFNYLDKAEIVLRKALQIDPIDSKIYQLLGDVMEKKGNATQAGEYRKKGEKF
ncbi:hypothetical protein COZ61_01390 [Candidatus Berkelbacteria bacterium CG_4_8_14_3_um_filter_33_6]|uniref:Tetratricopeptide repeat-like domain-containing protein n=1 Tax=Candidatus Berkelbacteria bacterium CG_4_10_14_0_2_um_filter_35_9_33_12 TaxID=1974499 RepID=A0A2M7W429_9BACT|nr:MAG: hypothetical protein COX10_01900 [Candidatus Berkelbacteria bacterium CG23_combo_of_CG06-09_8_20_14_all_33_15]PIS08311.1 MAG: hypothetical protein COT76_02150 [Candidatus Berkelbacteria bacterium CG10_big_fil_rev_8_21_14_0_10_33_10]PIX31133.1 MAG: hypothetical protein COZ61_01390 [Candidatus Berkelbacteria bacterium CG_4_8_14_3_um_filter_33_6]PIZ28124.1 MAG: hypothetical protein COY43_02210 [Candidatus Berkelbacteria bacterium CG_4_10_14_0_8_um_filter_35_9_33_8]PJA20410.1 MAG: hypotheti